MFPSTVMFSSRPTGASSHTALMSQVVPFGSQSSAQPVPFASALVITSPLVAFKASTVALGRGSPSASSTRTNTRNSTGFSS